MELEIELGELDLKDRIDESFDELIARDQYCHGPMVALNECRRTVKDNERIRIMDITRDSMDVAYLECLEMMVNKAGFLDMVVMENESRLCVEAVKRPPIVIDLGHNMELRETVNPDDVRRCHDTAREIYYYKDFNYDYDVARQFDLNSDMFAVYDGDEIVAIGRLIVRLPGYYCPFMYATMDNGIHFTVPAKQRRICEVMGLYVEGKRGIVAFKGLMENFAQYAYSPGRFDSIWTTYDDLDPYTGTYYKRKLLMNETDVCLTYRDFGGTWRLIYTDRIADLRDFKKEMFRR